MLAYDDAQKMMVITIAAGTRRSNPEPFTRPF
jgi:hypothetical protein